MPREQGGGMRNLICFTPSSPPPRKREVGESSNNYTHREIWHSELWMNTTDQGDLAQLLLSAHSHTDYFHLLVGGAQIPWGVKTAQKLERKKKRHLNPALRKEIKERLLLQVLLFCSPSILYIVKALHSTFRVFLLRASFAPPHLYSTPFPPPLWFWVKGKQFLFLLFSCSAFL